MDRIFAKLVYEMEKNLDTVLVTIIADQGSTPRGTGSQMLVGEQGRILGTIGGGAVEQKSEELALEVLRDESLAAMDRYRLFVWMLYRRPRPRGRRLVPAVCAALELLKVKEPYRLPRAQSPLLDLKQDAALICAAFCQQYGMNLPEEIKRLDSLIASK